MTRSLNHRARRALAPKPRFGRNVSFSKRKTARLFRPNLQLATVWLDGQAVRVQLSARQIKSLTKENPPKKLLAQLRRAVR